ncbi:MAG: J domain-containing protein [Spirochaetaceae bacterium]|jgi:DnaJ-domain-containing protein 1|nr:J domain-containing protein [Spirochaetaceae bacterium]
MGILDRLGRVLESRINDGFRRKYGNETTDPDLEDAYSELNDYLSGRDKAKDSFDQTRRPEQKAPGQPPVPEELKPDFAELGVPFGADKRTCKEAYKKLLKTHHPDRAHEGNMKKATEKTARVNAAYERIEKRRKEWDPDRS